MTRLFHLVVACAVSLSLVACGGGDDDDEKITPKGPHYGYVVSKATLVPAAPGLDLGSETSAELDGENENQLGTALATLTTFFPIQGTVDSAVANGSIILLVDVQTENFATSEAAGFGIKFGAMPNPPACTGPADMTCGGHLAGNAMFQIASGSPSNALLGGKIAGGTFNGGPGDIALQIAVGSTEAIPLDLHHARVRATGISETGLTASIGGLLTVTDLNTKVGPAIQAQVAGLLAEECTPAPPPGCGCTGDAMTVIELLDANDDCTVTTEEILGFQFVAQLLKPDSCSKDTCSEPDSLSTVISITAVKATFSF